MTKVIVMLSGNGTTLQSIIDRCILTKVVGVISDKKDAYGLTRARQSNIFNSVYVPYNNREQHAKIIIKYIDTIIKREGPIQFIVLAGYMRILPASFIKYYNDKGIHILNIHPSLLPKYKGLHTYKQVLDAEDILHGCTIHFVTPELDSGPIIYQHSFFIESEDTEESLEQKTRHIEQMCYPIVLDLLNANRLSVPFNMTHIGNMNKYLYTGKGKQMYETK